MRLAFVGVPSPVQIGPENIRAVHVLAHRLWQPSSDVDLEDLVGAGMEGLVRARDSFDSEKHLKFNSWAFGKIAWAIKDFLRSSDRLGRADRQRVKSGAAVPEEAKVPYHWQYQPMEGLPLSEIVPDPGPGPEEIVFNGELWEAVGQLPAREAMLISCYYMEGMTLREIGEMFGVTESRVSQMKGTALERLKGLVGSIT